MTNERTKFIRGLREAADFLERHPDLPVPYGALLGVHLYSREEVERVAATLDQSVTADGGYLLVREDFSGRIQYGVQADREGVAA